ncbi:protein bric-a-brac 1-like [Oratosquilla oratoria]|uniref:protein bric-a-brac 1-like n=1 Tax=Oratosquilla oratoria TaxID=337810 RepID=UPI003F759AAB
MANQQFCLRWNNYQSNLTQVFEQLLHSEQFVDVTLSCDGHSLKAHRMVLSACSPYFQTLLCEAACQHPIIILQGVNWKELKAVVEFMYKGEINICQDQLGSLLKVAESLKIRGLAEVGAEGEAEAVLASPTPSPGEKSQSWPEDSLSSARKRRRLSGDDLSRPSTPTSAPDLLETAGVDLPSALAATVGGRGSSSSGGPGTPHLGPPSLASSLSSLAAHLPGAMPAPGTPTGMPPHLAHLPPLSPLLNMTHLPRHHSPDDFEIRPGIAEMIREEERVSHAQGSLIFIPTQRF